MGQMTSGTAGTGETARAGLDHAWRHFELHAGQRMTVFNFYTVTSGLLAAGLAATIQGPAKLAWFGVILGLLVALASLVFWKLDQRAAWLLKHAERAMVRAETQAVDTDARVFTDQDGAFDADRLARNRIARPWTFGQSFRLLFLTMTVFGLTASFLCGLRAVGVVSWGEGEGSGAAKPGMVVVESAPVPVTSPSQGMGAGPAAAPTEGAKR